MVSYIYQLQNVNAREKFIKLGRLVGRWGYSEVYLGKGSRSEQSTGNGSGNTLGLWFSYHPVHDLSKLFDMVRFGDDVPESVLSVIAHDGIA